MRVTATDPRAQCVEFRQLVFMQMKLVRAARHARQIGLCVEPRIAHHHQLLQQLASRLHGREVREVVGTIGMRRSEEHTSELQSLMRISYAVFCLKKKKNINQ